MDLMYALLSITTIFGIVKSIMEFKNEKRFPLKPGISVFVIQFCTIVSLLVPKILLISCLLIRAPYLYALGLIAEIILIAGYNRLIFGRFSGNCFKMCINRLDWDHLWVLLPCTYMATKLNVLIHLHVIDWDPWRVL
jgi:hypothetical protein